MSLFLTPIYKIPARKALTFYTILWFLISTFFVSLWTVGDFYKLYFIKLLGMRMDSYLEVIIYAEILPIILFLIPIIPYRYFLTRHKLEIYNIIFCIYMLGIVLLSTFVIFILPDYLSVNF